MRLSVLSRFGGNSPCTGENMAKLDERIGFLGGGNMAFAIGYGLINRGIVFVLVFSLCLFPTFHITLSPLHFALSRLVSGCFINILYTSKFGYFRCCSF